MFKDKKADNKKNQNEEQKKYYFNLNYIKELPKIKFEKIIK